MGHTFGAFRLFLTDLDAFEHIFGMSKKSRTKGHSFERWVAKKLRGIFPEARRHLEYHSRDANGVDISNTGDFKIQCKRGKRYSSLTAIEEIQLCPIEGGIPVLVTKGDNKQVLVCMPFDAFLDLIARKKLTLSVG
jgi:hypothetical protein